METKDGLVLVDTGLGREDLQDVRGRLGPWFERVVGPRREVAHTAWAQVQALGFQPRDVRHIVPTHLDLDHAGGLPDFPHAQVHVFRPEYEAALAPANLRERERYRRVHFAHGPHWNIREQEGESWFGFAGVRAMDSSEELLLIPLLGHSRGHCGVAVKTKQGWLLHAGDAYFFHGEMASPPSCPAGLALFQRLVVTNNALRLRNQERLRQLVAEHGAEVTVHCAHCPTEFEHLSKPALNPQS